MGLGASKRGLVLSKLVIPDGARERLDRFELIAELASGGMATVFLARLSGAGGFQRLYAIKRLHPHLASDGEFIQMFLDEARLAARIHHPNVVPILEIGTAGEPESGDVDRYYLVMEYIEGDTVARLIARAAHAGKKLPVAVSIRIVLDALAGLHAAHELRDDDGNALEIVHRDVSPQNILVGVDGIARITDFGVARAASRLSTTRSGQLKGKLAYMAPEQARASRIDRRADVFAMGICLWETLASRRLFKGDGEAQTLNRVLYEPIPVLRAVDPSIPEALSDVCMKALERDPDKRFATAAELATALETAAQSVQALGLTRDVIACVEDVMGSELVEQREALRVWRARSDPGRKESVPPPRASGEVLTRAERAANSLTPPGVSSVSSATLQVSPDAPSSTSAVEGSVPRATPHGRAQGDALLAPSRRRHAGLWTLALLATAAVAAWLGLEWRQSPIPPRAEASVATATRPGGGGAPASPAGAREREGLPVAPDATDPHVRSPDATDPHLRSPDATDPHFRSPDATAPSLGTTEGVASVRSASPRGSHPHARVQGTSPAPVKPVEPEAAPAALAPAPGAPVPDDITHNPYR